VVLASRCAALSMTSKASLTRVMPPAHSQRIKQVESPALAFLL
jgi:hypothetical protein